MRSRKVQFTNANGYHLAASLELPANSVPHNYAIFAHVFTGNKNLGAVRHISRSLTTSGIAVLRFDFTGLGESEGDFAETNFTSNVEDLLAAARFLEENYAAPTIIIGHSLGGAASIFAASQISSIKAVATIGAPSKPEHVTHLLRSKIEDIEKLGFAKVNIGGREFLIKKQFLDDLRSKDMDNVLKHLKKALLVMHSPQDKVVEIGNAAHIYSAAHHPKSFITLDGADHMLTDKNNAAYAGNTIASWVSRYIELPEKETLTTEKQVVAKLGIEGFTTEIRAGQHGLLADESEAVGGDDFGPSPYELLSAALAACTAMTLQMYARQKQWDLKEVKVHINHHKKYADDCADCENLNSKIDHFEKCIEMEGDLSADQVSRLLEIADCCPIQRTLLGDVVVETKLWEEYPG